MRFRRGSLIWVVTFVLVTLTLVVISGSIFAQVRIEDTARYRAVFVDAAGLRSGVDVRASGVVVGKVGGIVLHEDGVLVSFSVPDDLPMTESTQARIRYANLTGDRYLDLTPGEDRSARAMRSDDEIPISRTQPALDLDTLFAGFDPLMQALDPKEVNQLTANLLAVTDGQSGAVEAMLASVGSFTTKLAERDRLIGSVITNLTDAVATVDDRRPEVERLIGGLDGLVADLARDRKAITSSLVGINELSADTAGLLREARPSLKANIDQLGVAAGTLNDYTKTITEVLELYPSTIQRLGRGGTYGSFFNFFLCSVEVEIQLPGQPAQVVVPEHTSSAARCKFPEDR